jgi:hypothetical protein
MQPMQRYVVGDIVELNSGGPPMTVAGISTPGRNTDVPGTSDIVVWWRLKSGKPQIAELDSRCVHRNATALQMNRLARALQQDRHPKKKPHRRRV